MIYFDNGSTTKNKPEETYQGFTDYIREIGVSPGRGSYSLAIKASRMLYQTRMAVGSYFGLSNGNVVFTKNSTEAINMLFQGILHKGDHVVITPYEHNAVLRPLHFLKEKGIITYSVIERKDLELPPAQIYEKYCHKNTTLYASTLASNLTGRILFQENLSSYLSQKGISTFLDASQGAGIIPLSMEEMSIDYLAFTGHKDLMALPGVGGLCFRNIPDFPPLLQGGTGVHSEEYTNPCIFPDGYEAGTLNMPAIWSLHESLFFVQKNKEVIKEKEEFLCRYLIQQLEQIPDIIIYDKGFSRIATVGINHKRLPSSQLNAFLNQQDICVRGGLHCALLPHNALNTLQKGMVRISLGYYNEKEEIDTFLSVLRQFVATSTK